MRVRFVSRVFISSIFLFVFTPTSFGQESVKALNRVEWTDIDPAKRDELLEMMADQIEGNFAKLKTWKGAYDVSMMTLISAENAREMIGAESFGETGPTDVQQTVRFEIQFAIDVGLDSIYRSKNTSAFEFRRTGAKSALKVKAFPLDENTVLSKEHFLSVGDHVVPAHSVLRDHPDAHNKRTCYRDTADCISAADMGLSGLLDPRDFYGLNDRTKTYSDHFRFYSQGYAGPNTPLELAEGTLDGDRCYRLIVGLGDLNYVLYASAAAGFHPVVASMGSEKSGLDPEFLVETSWESIGGVFVPSHVRRVHRKTDGTISLRRDAKLLTTKINPKLDRHQFDYVGLGLKEGELIMDKIENVAYTLGGNGKRIKIAAFGDKYTPPSLEKEFFTRRLLTGVTFLLVLVLLGMVIRRRIASA